MAHRGLQVVSVMLGMWASATVCGQTYYKWTDAQGVTHYSAQHSAGKVEAVTLHPGVHVEPARAATVRDASSAVTALDVAAVEFRKQACLTAKENLRLLAGSGMVLASGTASNPSGVEAATKLSSEQRDAAKVTAQKNVESYCSRG